MQWVQLHILPILLTMLRYRVFWPSITTKSFYRFELCLWYQLSTWWKQRLSTKCVFELKRKPDVKSTSSLTINRKLEPAIVDEIRHPSSRVAFPNFLKLTSKQFTSQVCDVLFRTRMADICVRCKSRTISSKCQFVSMWGVVCCARRIPMKTASLRTCMCQLGPKSMLVNISWPFLELKCRFPRGWQCRVFNLSSNLK